MSTIEQPTQPVRIEELTEQIGRDGEPCAGCGAALAGDQRYCLNCGRRRGAPRVTLDALGGVPTPPPPRPAAPAPAVAAPAAAVAPGRRSPSAVVALLALAAGVGLGAILWSGEDTAPPAKAQAPAATTTWPAGREGWTLALQRLPKPSTSPAELASVRADARAAGARRVGSLFAGDYPSLGRDEYIVFSGIYPSATAARDALGTVQADYPDAEVVFVGDEAPAISGDDGGGADKPAKAAKKKPANKPKAESSAKKRTVDRKELSNLQKLSPTEYQKRSRKLPDETKVPGKAPAKDDKEAGGGSGALTIE